MIFWRFIACELSGDLVFTRSCNLLIYSSKQNYIRILVSRQIGKSKEVKSL